MYKLRNRVKESRAKRIWRWSITLRPLGWRNSKKLNVLRRYHLKQNSRNSTSRIWLISNRRGMWSKIEIRSSFLLSKHFTTVIFFGKSILPMVYWLRLRFNMSIGWRFSLERGIILVWSGGLLIGGIGSGLLREWRKLILYGRNSNIYTFLVCRNPVKVLSKKLRMKLNMWKIVIWP